MTQDRPKGRRFVVLSYGLVALVAAASAYFYLFYGHAYLFPPSLPTGPGCSPVSTGYLDARADGKTIRIEQTNCVRDGVHVALYLDGRSGNGLRPILVFGADKPTIHAVWTSPDHVLTDIAANDAHIDYMMDRFHGVQIDYTLHEAAMERH